MHTSQGVFELRFFFSEGVHGPEGGSTPLMLLKRKVKKLIDEEDPRKPLTDDLIASMLEAQGIDVTAAPWPNIAKTCAYPAPTNAGCAIELESCIFESRRNRLGSVSMPVECTGRQVVITKPLRTLAEEGIERIAKILGKITSAHVVLTAEKYRQMAEVTVKTRACTFVALCESSSSMETALREALVKAETQVTRHKDKQRSRKRQPKPEKQVEETAVARSGRGVAESKSAKAGHTNGAGNGKGHAQPAVPVTVHSFPARVPIAEPHVVRSLDSVALRPMTLEEAVKEAEFRDRDVFVFRDNEGNVKVLHRKRDGKMELIEAP